MNNEPRIEDLQVSVRVVRVGTKQMTLQFFRQLERFELCDGQGHMVDGVTPWGFVNVVVDDLQPWLLAEVGGQLKRAVLNKADMTDHFKKWIADWKATIDSEERSRSTSPDGRGSPDAAARIARKRQQVGDYEQQMAAEPQRLKVHQQMCALPQLFLGA